MSGRGWLEGTMEVISGGPARASQRAPPPSQTGTTRPRSPSPLQNRIPSRDALDRSLHNDSGHGKSAAQIIKDLRAANAALTSKTADMEADFMNQINAVKMEERQMEERHAEDVRRRDQQIQGLEKRCNSTEKRIRERDQQLAAVKEEKAFQVHQLSDLKNQLYQLQHEIEEAEFDKQDEVQKWEIKLTDATRKAEEIEKAKADLQSKVDAAESERDAMKLENEKLRTRLDVAEREKSNDVPAMVADDGSDDRDAEAGILQSWKQLEETQKTLADTERRLHETQSSLASLENQSKRTVNEHADVLSSLQTSLDRAIADKAELEKELKNQVDAVATGNKREIADLRSMLRARDDAIASLQERVSRYQEDMASLEVELDEVRGAGQRDAAREQRDEEEIRSLRQINEEREKTIDSQRVEIDRLTDDLKNKDVEIDSLRNRLTNDLDQMTQCLDEVTKSLDEKTKSLDEQTELNSILTEESNELQTKVAILEKSLKKKKSEAKGASDQRVADLEVQLAMQLANSKEKVAGLETKLTESANAHEKVMVGLRQEINDLRRAKDEAESRFLSRIEELERERDGAAEDLEELREKERSARTAAREEESRSVGRLRGEIADVTRERAKLESEHAKQLAAIESARKTAVSKLENALREKEEDVEKYRLSAEELEKTVDRLQKELDELKDTKEKMTQQKDREVDLVRRELETFRSITMQETERKKEELQATMEQQRKEDKSRYSEIKKQLRESQMALVALDDEKVRSCESSEKKMESMREDLLKAKESLSGLKKKLKEQMESVEKDMEGERLKHVQELSNREDKISQLNGLVSTQEMRVSQLEAEVGSLKSQLQEESRRHEAEVDTLQKKAAEAESSRAAELAVEVEKLKVVLHDREDELEQTKRSFDVAKKDISSTETSLIYREMEHSQELEEMRVSLEDAKKEVIATENLLKQRETELNEVKLSSEAEVEERLGSPGKQDTLSKELADSKAAYADMENKLLGRISSLEKLRAAVESGLKSKLEDRDTTISALVKSSVTQEQKLSLLKAEVERLQSQVDEDTTKIRSGSHNRSRNAVDAARAANHKEELDEMRNKLDWYRNSEESLSREVTHLRRELSAAEDETTRLRAQLDHLQEGRNEAESKGRLEQTVAEYEEMLQERDSRMSSLVKQSIAQEQQVASLQAEIEKLKQKAAKKSKSKPGPSWEEVRRLQQESEIFAGQIIEQDEEMEELKAALDSRNAQNEALSREVNSLKSKISALENDAANVSEMKDRLDEVEQSSLRYKEELDDVKRRLNEAVVHEERVEELERALKTSSDAHAQKVLELEGELKTAKAALETEKLRALPKMDEMEEEDLRKDLEAAIASKEATEERLNKQIASLRKLRNSAVEEFEAKLRDRDEVAAELEAECKQLTEKIRSLEEEMDDARVDIDISGGENSELVEAKTELAEAKTTIDDQRTQLSEMKTMVKEQNHELEELRNELVESKTMISEERAEMEELRTSIESGREENEEEIEMLRLKNQALSREVENLKSDHPEVARIAELEAQLAEAEEARVSVEKSALSTYERKLSLLQLNKDVEIDSLRKKLAEAKEKQSDKELEQLSRMQELERENRDLKDDLVAKLEHKNAKIMALEQTLAAQDQVVGNMSSEMDQLQSGMEKISIQRRAECEEMQQEVMDSTAKATRLEREVMALQMKLEERKLRHKDDVAKLEDKIVQLEAESPLARGIQSQRDDHRVEELNEKMDKLKWRNVALHEECEKLRARLEKVEAEGTASSKNDKWRVSKLQEQVAILSQRVVELEGTSSATSRRSGRHMSPSPILRVSSSDTADNAPRPNVRARPAAVTENSLRAIRQVNSHDSADYDPRTIQQVSSNDATESMTGRVGSAASPHRNNKQRRIPSSPKLGFSMRRKRDSTKSDSSKEYTA